MVVETFVNFSEWIGSASLGFAGLALTASVLGLFFGYLVASFRHGPFEAFYIVAQVCAEAIPDFIGTSFRRVMAIARLAVKEALRRRVILVTFGIFAVALLFGGWFMNSGSDHPDRIYVNFVLWGTQLLVLMMGMLISAFSLPDDIKKKTVYTIVTKPVRATEIVIGRIVGFGFLGTCLLLLMGIISFLFVWGGLSHNHKIVGDSNTIAEFTTVDPSKSISDATGKRVSANAIMEAFTGNDSGHSHRVEVVEEIRDADKAPKFQDNILRKTTRVDGKVVYERVYVVPYAGHTHSVNVGGNRPSGDEDFYAGDDAEITLGSANGYFRARVPTYASNVVFYNREGQVSRTGIDVGREWRYRGYVDGGNYLNRNSLAKAVFQFDGFNETQFRNPEVLPLEMTLGVFRTYKGDIEKRVIASIQFETRLPKDSTESKFQSEPIIFETNEYTLQTLPISRKQMGRKLDANGQVIEEGEFDLFEDYAKNGMLDLIIRCEDRNQYIGVARADVYFRTKDNLYWLNFIKGYLGIWCQMMIVIAMGVALSTFLSAPIVMLSSLVLIILGFWSTFISTMMQPDVAGGGPIESFVRLITQKNMQVDLETGIATTLMEQADYAIVWCLEKLTYIAPDFSKLNFSDYLTYGYSIDNTRMAVAIVISLAFCVGLSVFGYFCLKTREIAK